MILQALDRYYVRANAVAPGEMPEFGFSRERIGFAIVLDAQGNKVQEKDLRTREGKRTIWPEMIVPLLPEVAYRTSGVQTNFLVDKAADVLGADKKTKPKRLKESFQVYRQLLRKVASFGAGPDLGPVLRFVESWNPAQASQEIALWDEIADENSSGFIAFQIDGEQAYIHEKPAVREAWHRFLESRETGPPGQCLISGKETHISPVHGKIAGVRNAQTSGASLVSFNQDSFESYGKKQSLNAPVGEAAAFRYVTALNNLLSFSSRRKIQIGDATTVFWSERDTPVEGYFGMVFGSGEDAADTADLRRYLESVREGRMPAELDPDARFYVLGLSPNASRLSVRFWYAGTAEDISRRLGQHFEDLRIVRRFETEREYPSVQWLLRETAVLRKDDNLPPLLAGAVMRAVLTGGDYPRSLLIAVIRRLRAGEDVSYYRAALLKACLVRHARIQHTNLEVTMSLDPANPSVAYRLGRLFAALEKVQQEAINNPNATIRDRYFGSASATPRIVFPQLLRLAQHHIQKAAYGGATERRIEEILEGIQEFPAHLSLEDQGLFAIGYYHQRQAFFQKKTDKNEEE